MSPDPLVVLAGLGFGLSLIVAIGAQNAFVLRQGLRGEHVALVVAVCVVSDVALIAAGVAGAAALVDRAPGVVTWIRLGGAAFLLREVCAFRSRENASQSAVSTSGTVKRKSPAARNRNATRVEVSGHSTAAPAVEEQSTSTCTHHTAKTNAPAGATPILSRRQSLASPRAMPHDPAAITANEWVGP